MNSEIVKKLELFSKKVRYYLISCSDKKHTFHFGGCLSCVELIIYIYFEMFNDFNPEQKERDRFILSKGHAALTLYVTLALKGYIKFEELYTYKELDSNLQGHPDMKRISAIDFSTASLGQGLSAGIGYSLANKIRSNNSLTVVLIGDGEMQEGQIWEAAMCASKYDLDNLYCIVDYNKLQVDGRVSEIMPIENLVEKWRSFGWAVFEINDGHSFGEIDDVIKQAKKTKGKPVLFIANTIKGKGISFMENKKEWHSNVLNDELYKLAMKEVSLNEL